VSELAQFLDVSSKKQNRDSISFKLKEGSLFVEFSKGNCILGAWGSWNVDEGTIISLTFYPKKMRKPAAYKLDKEGMKQGYNSEHLYYKSDEKGLYYSTQFGKVTSIIYTPANKYENLKCSEK
jgi:hypothetical protein